MRICQAVARRLGDSAFLENGLGRRDTRLLRSTTTKNNEESETYTLLLVGHSRFWDEGKVNLVGRCIGWDLSLSRLRRNGKESKGQGTVVSAFSLTISCHLLFMERLTYLVLC